MNKETIECPSCGEVSLKPIASLEEGTSVWTEYECECGHYQQSPSPKYRVSVSMRRSPDLWAKAIELIEGSIAVEISQLVNEAWECRVMAEDCSWHEASNKSLPKAIIEAFDIMEVESWESI